MSRVRIAPQSHFILVARRHSFYSYNKCSFRSISLFSLLRALAPFYRYDFDRFGGESETYSVGKSSIARVTVFTMNFKQELFKPLSDISRTLLRYNILPPFEFNGLLLQTSIRNEFWNDDVLVSVLYTAKIIIEAFRQKSVRQNYK